MAVVPAADESGVSSGGGLPLTTPALLIDVATALIVADMELHVAGAAKLEIF